MTDSAAASNISSNGGAKPAAGHLQGPSASTTPCNAGDANCTPATGAESAAITATPSPADAATKDATDSGKPDDKKTAAKNTTPELTSAPQSLTGIMVQVAAVSKQEDADALVKALRKKEYPVFVVTQADNKLFHVQVGPFAQQRDAEAMRAKLSGDGYNAIIKK
jgi:cell division septation protein DedD